MTPKTPGRARRQFIYQVGMAATGISLFSFFQRNKKPVISPAEWVLQNRQAGKLGIALVGLGGYAGGQLAPALQQTEHCYLAGIVTGTPSKEKIWGEKYNIPPENIYNYNNFDSIRDNPAIDIIYIVLPNALHASFTIRAAQAGKHVICEKPMALTVEDCTQMINACQQAGKKLSVGYRLHFEPYNMEMARLGTRKIYGEVKSIEAGFGFPIGDPLQWRLKKSLAGGGPLQDVGIYCIQGICYTCGMEPLRVTAQEGPRTDDKRFSEVEQSLTWQFEMPGGWIANGQASYANNMNFLKATAEKGVFELTSAYNYSGQKGYSPAGPMNFPKVIQQARQMDDFALAVKLNRPSPVPGEMGKRDVKIISAIYEAMKTGNSIQITSD